MSIPQRFPSTVQSDIIDNLPVDESIPSQNELQILDTLFKKQLSIFERLLHECKDILLAGFLFIIFSTPQSDTVLLKIVPQVQNSYYIRIIAKCVCFMFVYFVIKNLHLARR